MQRELEIYAKIYIVGKIISGNGGLKLNNIKYINKFTLIF